MKKILAVFLTLAVSLFGGINFGLAAGLCEVCDGEACDSGLRCLEGVCQPEDQVVFCSPITHKTFGGLIDAIISFIFNVAIVVVPLLIIIGAFNLLTAAGDPKKIATGKNIITYTLIGFAIILFAKGLIAMIEEVIGVKIGG